MSTRRDFVKKAAMGSAAVTAASGFSVINSHCTSETKKSAGINPFPGWEVSFNEASSSLLLKNGLVTIQGKIVFYSGKDKWSILRSRDRLKDRFTLADTQNNVQGYFKCNHDCGRLMMFFYHRSGKAYEGSFSFVGEAEFLADSFACRTKPGAEEKVLNLSFAKADSPANDSLFSPLNDVVLRFEAADLKIKTEGPGSFSLVMSGNIQRASDTVIIIDLEKDFLRNRYIPYYNPINRNRCPKAPTGWMSWNTYFDKATADDNLAEARIGQKYLQPFGCEFWHIESWQGNSDKLPVRNFYNMNLEVSEKKFPEGMKKLAEDIKELGFRPGIWMAPFGTGNEEFYKEHKEWFVHDKNGKPVSCWNGRFTVDPTVPEALAHLKHIHEVASHEWGYEYFKIDGMSGAGPSYGAHFYERPDIRELLLDPSNPNPYELCLKTFREAMGEDRVWLACGGHATGPDVLYTDAERIGADVVHPDQPINWKGVYDQGRCTLNRVYTNNIVTYTDPDTLLVHDLSLEEARVAATVVALPGQLTFFADKLAGLTGERMKILQQTLPVADVLPMNLYPYYSMLPVWNLSVRNRLTGDYNVVALFNWSDEESVTAINPADIGTDPSAEIILHEFWTQKFLGIIKDSISLNLPPHSVRLLAVHQKKNIPQWLSSDRHITQTAMELKEYEWDTAGRMLKGKIELIGSFPLTMKIFIPEDYYFRGAECTGAECITASDSDRILSVTMKADTRNIYPFIIRF